MRVECGEALGVVGGRVSEPLLHLGLVGVGILEVYIVNCVPKRGYGGGDGDGDGLPPPTRTCPTRPCSHPNSYL